MFELLFKRLLPYILPYKFKVAGVIIFSACLATIGGWQVSLVKPLFDAGLSPTATIGEVAFLAGQLLFLGILNFPCRFFHFYWLRFIRDRATCALRLELFNKLLKLPVSFFNRSKQGQVISRIINDSDRFAMGLKASIDLIREPLKALVYLGMAFWADWQLTAVILAITPFLLIIFGVSGRRIRRNQGEVQKECGELTHSIAESFGANKITKAFNLQKFIFHRFDNSQKTFFSAQMKTTFVEEISHPFVELVGACAFSGVIVFAHYRIQSGAVTVGEFVAFVAALALFMDPIRKFSEANVHLGQAYAASDRLQELFDLPEETDQGKVELAKFEQDIAVRGLTFRYEETDVIKGLDLTVKKGEKVAIVGNSGAGKSTFVDLLLGFYPVERGSILIDGHPLSELTLASLRNLFGLVGQELFLFHDSVRANLCLGRDFSEAAIWQALEVAYASGFVRQLSCGLDTVIGDRGVRLSGGQQQRLTIARAYLQDAPILLFDEATSALDNESEKVVQKALENLAGHKTVIAVAHRLSTIQDFDRIYVVKEGKLIEQGNHRELMALGGEYAKLYELSIKS